MGRKPWMTTSVGRLLSRWPRLIKGCSDRYEEVNKVLYLRDCVYFISFLKNAEKIFLKMGLWILTPRNSLPCYNSVPAKIFFCSSSLNSRNLD
jgi:hypothetical protein